jgi:aspartate ammonia-lyase
MNEVLSNRATEILGGELGKYDLVTLEDVNLFQSSNDVVPTAAKHSTIVIAKGLIVEAKKLLKTFQEKSKQYNKVIKLGRNRLQDSLRNTILLIHQYNHLHKENV